MAPLAAVPALWSTSPAAATQRSSPAGPWQIGAKPDYKLAIATQEVQLFGQPIQGLLVNGAWPGTTIRYSKGDRFRVLVENFLDQPTSLHWHGLIAPNLEDGVPSVTQAPIGPGDTLYYEFDLQQAGTFWYHSHFGLQEQQGLGGPLIIEDPNEPQAYDEDLVVMLGDVIDIPVGDVIPRIRNGTLQVSVSNPYTLPDGAPFRIDVPYTGYLLNGRTPDDPWRHALKAGSRARLRLINGSGSSFFRIAIDGVRLTLIAADGDPVEPVVVDNLVIGTAQRYDVLVTLPESGSYTLHATALGDDKQALGVLHTPDVAPAANAERPKFGGEVLKLTDLKAPYITTPPDGSRKSFEVVLSGDMRDYLWEMNDQVWPEPFAAYAGDAPCRQVAPLPSLPRRRGPQGVAAAVEGASGARSAHRARWQPACRLLPGPCPLGRGGLLDRALRHHGEVAERLSDAEPLRRGGEQTGRHHGADRCRVRHDPKLPHSDPGR